MLVRSGDRSPPSMNDRTSLTAYTAALLVVGVLLIVVASLTLGSVGSAAMLAFGAAAVAAGLVLVGLRLSGR